jgi:hypothetical protein
MKSAGLSLGARVAIIVVGTLAHGCGSSPAAAGVVGGSCLGDGTCNSALVCLSQICVQPADAGAAGLGGGGNGGGGNGGTGGVLDCTAASTVLAPTSGLIADFTGPDGGIDVAGGLRAYPRGGAAAPTLSTSGSALRVVEDSAPMSTPQYVGVALVFAKCIDATAFSGVQFSLSGTLSGCTMQYATGDVEHQDPSTGAPYATGQVGDYQPQATIAPTEITSAAQTIMVPFVGGDLSSGNPAIQIDKTKLNLLFWQFTISPASTTGTPSSCAADVTVDDVRFY